MRNVHKSIVVAGMAAMTVTGASAQSIGTACGCPPVSSRTPVNISTLVDATTKNLLNANTTLTCNNVYTLDTRVYVDNGQDLFVEPGTVVKANSNVGAAHAIIVTRGGQIWANGSESCPIIFTAAADPLDGTYSVQNRGQWGSLIVLGRAYTNKRTADGDATATATNGVGTIEGLAAGDNRHLYGSPVGSEVNEDNSGVLRYVSLRHGGQVIGANNEINGLTLGGVGSGTTIDHVEVIANLDDGFEFFGGTVSAKYLVAMHCDDDYIDYDQGWNGKLQFVYGVQGPDNGGGALNQGDNGIEADGDDAATNAANGGIPSNPNIYNATFIARNLNDEGIEAKERTQGTIVNSVFARFAQGLNMTTAVETVWNGGQFNVKNCTFQEVTNPLRINSVVVSSGAAFTKFTATDGNLVVAANALIDAGYAMTQPGNVLTDRINPVPAAGTATSTIAPPVDGFFTGAKYRGAFQPGAAPWTTGWTLAGQIGLDVSAAAGCAGDINRDGIINITDFNLLSANFGGNCF
ncbi:MAG: hypothetical protein JNM62_02525 [Flavobacteriales bacterium]|nr:hypothetical protein [Flavobacteriales bacterium]